MANPGQTLRFHLGANTRRVRERQGLTQAKLAVAVGREMLAIQRWEAGAQGTIELLAEIAAAMGVTPGSLCRPVTFRKRKAGRPPKARSARRSRG